MDNIKTQCNRFVPVSACLLVFYLKYLMSQRPDT